MKKILLISHLFYPNNTIGAVRPTKLAEFLLKKGYSVDVVTQNVCQDDSLTANISSVGKIVRLSDSKLGDISVADKPRISKTTKEAQKNGIQSKLPEWIKYCRRYSLHIKRAKVFCENFKKAISDGVIDISQYDVVISSFGPFHSLFCGFEAKKQNPSIRWICDFRDPIVILYVPWILKRKFRAIEIKACEEADVITAVSNGYRDRICKEKYRNKSAVITNGFDVSDIANAVERKNDKFTFTYVGSLYDGARDLSPLFKAIRELADEGKICLDKIAFEYAGKGKATLYGQASKYSLEQIVHSNGLLGRQDCLNLQMSSDCLVLATWNTKKELGVFPGKMLEYMLFNKPIVSLVSGDLSNCEVTQIIDELKIGASYEEAQGTKEHFENFKEYVFGLISGELNFAPDKDKIYEYEWSGIIKKFEDVING